MTIKDLIPSPKELKSETYFDFGHIKRSSDQDGAHVNAVVVHAED